MKRHIPKVILLSALAGAAWLPSIAAHAQISDLIGSLAAKVVGPGQADASATRTLESLGIGELPVQGGEMSELFSPKSLLLDSPTMQKFLGEYPRFVYNPQNRPDPMLIPWTQSRVVFSELEAIANQAIEQKNWKMAEMAFQKMLTLDSEAYRIKADEGLRMLETMAAQDAETQSIASGKPIEAKLPPWIESNTNGVIIDENEPMCLVGTYILKVGDLVPRQPVDVSVAKIESAAVHYRVLDKIFIVPIREGE